MRDSNPRLRPHERFELSLDGRQIASIVVGALVILAVVFVLGLNVGKQIGVRRAESARAGDLEALDRAPAPPAPDKADALTFHDRLTKEAPPPPAPDVAKAPEPPPAAPPPEPAPQPAPQAAAAPAPEARDPDRTETESAASKPWTVQLAASQDRAEAGRMASRFAALNPRIEEADVPGKGRFYRVRVGGFDSRDDAERYLRDVARETGARGFVTPSR